MPIESIKDSFQDIGKTREEVNLKLNDFLRNFGLRSEYQSPYVTYETDIILKDGLASRNDILVAYNQRKLFNNSLDLTEKKFSIITAYETLSDRVTLINPPSISQESSIGIRNLNDAIRISEDPRFGFYVVEPNL